MDREKKILVVSEDPDQMPGRLPAVRGFQFTHVVRSSFYTTPAEEALGYAGLILDCDLMNRAKLEFLLKLPSQISQSPIVILAEQISIYSYRSVDLLRNVVTLQKPFAPEVFQALLNRLIAGADIKPKVCPRFITNEPITLTVIKTGLMIPTRMRNYSSGGAFVEYRGISLRVGDKVQLNLPCPDLPNHRSNLQLKAKVIWIREGDSPQASLRGVGVQFLGSITA